MEAPTVTRHRRPFLAPVWLTFLAVICVLGVALAVYRSASTTVVVLVRPAEKEAGAIDDPPLSPDGELRAQRLAQLLGETTGVGRLDGIYVADARRAQQMIAPLADRLGMKPIVIPGDDAHAIVSRMTRGHEGGVVLFVGNGHNVPRLVNELAGVDVSHAKESDHDTLYVVSVPTFGHPSILRLTY